jgi:hypothetical protein
MPIIAREVFCHRYPGGNIIILSNGAKKTICLFRVDFPPAASGNAGKGL